MRKRWLWALPAPAREPVSVRGVAALLAWLALEELAWAAEPSFPRGPGFYYHPVKLACLLLLYFGWLAACGWVERDVRQLGTSSSAPTALMLAAGLAGLAIVWLMP